MAFVGTVQKTTKIKDVPKRVLDKQDPHQPFANLQLSLPLRQPKKGK